MRLPCNARVVAFERADGVGLLELDTGEQVRFGVSACIGFTPDVGISCWLVEAQESPTGLGVRAKVVNLSGAVEPSRLAPIQASRAAVPQRSEALGARAYDVIRERTGFEVPALYRRMENDRVLHYGESVRAPPALGCVYDFEWLTMEEMAAWEPPDHWNTEHVLVPFAKSARVDLWCWYPGWASEGETPVVLTRGDMNEAEALAPDFESLLLRKMLEAFAGALSFDDASLRERAVDVNDGNLREILRANVETLRPYIRGEWCALLLRLLARPFSQIPGESAAHVRLLDERELHDILHREAAFAHAGETFPYMLP